MELKGFISYAHKDKLFSEFRALWDKQLSLDKDMELDTWTDLQIPIGSQWDKEIIDSIQQANIVVMLISEAFCRSEYIQSHEVPHIFRHANNFPCVIAPILLSPLAKLDETGISEHQFFYTNAN